VIVDCPTAVHSIPEEVARHGYELLHQEQDGPTLVFLIRVPAARGGPATA
jgi:TusA-related sulfurtransferase